MSVIVKNMEMPERCGRCFFVRWSNLHQTALCTLVQEACFEDFSKDYKSRRADFCPLVELPPHSDLVDRNKLLAEYDRQHKGPAGGARRIMEQADAVIEAEGSES